MEAILRPDAPDTEEIKWSKGIIEDQSGIDVEEKGTYIHEECIYQEEILSYLSNIKQDNDESSNREIDQVRNDKRILTYDYNGETFELHQKNDLIYLNHPDWSLVGMGDTLLNAELDMIQDAKLIAEEYIYTPDTELSNEAIKLKKFLLTIV